MTLEQNEKKKFHPFNFHQLGVLHGGFALSDWLEDAEYKMET